MKQLHLNPILIDINDYERAGEGANGTSYNHKTDSSIMLKLNNKGADVGRVIRELEEGRKVFNTGIPTPEPGDFVTDGERYGIRFHRIVGKKSYARACGDNPEKAEQYGIEFADMCLNLHSTRLDTKEFANVKTYYLQILDNSKFYTEEEKEKVRMFINKVPDAYTAIHGDLHSGNAIFAGSKRYFIDLENFCYGHPYFDLGMTALVCCYDSEEFLMEFFHMDKITAAHFWESFVKRYFGGKYTAEEAALILKPYVALKNLIIERDSNSTVPCLRELYDSIF